MLSQLSSIGSKVAAVISFIIPLFKGAGEIAKHLEELEPDNNKKYGEQEREIAVDLLMAIYDIINDVTEDDLPIARDTLKKFMGTLVDIAVKAYNLLNIFS